MSTQDEDLMATLTDEERAAMADDTDDQDALAAIAGDADPASITGTGNDDPNASDDDDEDDEDDGPADPNLAPLEGKGAADAPATTETPATSAPEAAAATDATAGDAGEAGETLQTYRAELPADFDARVAAVTTRTSEIQQQFNDGEIDLAERDAELAKVSGERDELNRVRARVESLQEINAQNAQRNWQNQIVSFMTSAAKEQGGIDYRTDEAKAKDLDKYVKILAQDDDNADRDGPWFLAEAHKLVKVKHGIVSTAPAPAPKTDAQKIAEAKAKRAPALGDVPKNLASVPGSDGPGDVGDEFADVLALDGQELEDAIGRMTPMQRQKFLAS